MKILVIRLKHIGDALLCSTICESLRRTFPDAQIDYLLYEHIGVLFESHPAIDNVITISPEDRKNKYGYLKKILGLRNTGYDVVLDLITVPITVLITVVTGARMQIGFDKGKWRSRLYKTRVPHDRSLGWLESKLAILHGLTEPVTIDRTIRIALRNEEVIDMRARMDVAGVRGDKPVIIFSPISRMGLKNWPADYFVTLIRQVLNSYDCQGVLLWGPGEQEQVSKIAAEVNLPRRVFATIQTGTLRELAALARNSVLFVGNDSGPRHVAEAAGIPTFAIYSPDVRKAAWSPNLGSQHQALDMMDVLAIDETQWFARVADFRARYEDYYRQITPTLVFDRLRPMLADVVLPMQAE